VSHEDQLGRVIARGFELGLSGPGDNKVEKGEKIFCVGRVVEWGPWCGETVVGDGYGAGGLGSESTSENGMIGFILGPPCPTVDEAYERWQTEGVLRGGGGGVEGYVEVELMKWIWSVGGVVVDVGNR